MIDPSYDAKNRAQTERLKRLRSCSDEQLLQPVSDQWTVAIVLAHLQYLDGRALGAIEAWRRYGTPLNLWTDAEAFVTNDLRTPLWREAVPREALEQAIRTAERLDDVLADLTAAEQVSVAGERVRVLHRFLHRGDHLDDIERALGSWQGSS
jgi:hypothetical protein